jgi:hypothetical protein
MNINVLEMPLDLGASRHGSDMGPSAIHLAGLKEKITELGHTITKFSCPMEQHPQEYEDVGNLKAKYLPIITKACEQLAEKVDEAASNNEFPIILGGDHSIVLGSLAGMSAKWLIVPIAMVIGYFIVAAEPAVHVLTRQVSDATDGAIRPKALKLSLSIGVAVSCGLAMLRVLTGISIYYMLVPGYAIAIGLTFVVPGIFTAIAFDSGGVASGPMTATFLLPFAMGACMALGGNVITDAFGVVAMVAMTPLITIQVMGLYSRVMQRRAMRKVRHELLQIEDDIIFYTQEEHI